MPALMLGKREPLALPEAGATGTTPAPRGYAREVTLDGVRFRVTFRVTTPSTASAEWRTPKPWTEAVVEDVPPMGAPASLLFRGRVHAGSTVAVVLQKAGLAVVCPLCKELRGVWRTEESWQHACEDCAKGIAFHPEEKRAEVYG